MAQAYRNTPAPLDLDFGGPSDAQMMAAAAAPARRQRSKAAWARRAQYWERKTYPYDKFFKRYYPRNQHSRRLFGQNWRTANAEQRERRTKQRMVGQGRYYSGQGGFWGDVWKKVRTPLYDLGATGLKTIAPWSSDIVDATRKTMKAHGYGAYVTNALINGGRDRAEGVPSFGRESDTGSVRVVHRKFIRDIYAPETDQQDFSPQEIHINPGLEESFPWLSQVAANYDSYKLNQCIFTFKSTVAEFQTTTGVVGDVIMAVQYNKHDKPFSDSHSMKEFHGSVSGKSTDTILCGVECDPRKTAGNDHKFVRYQGIPESEDKQDYDKGVLTFATNNLPSQLAGHKIGELWVSYNVTLMHPKLVTADAKSIRQDIAVHLEDSSMECMGHHSETETTGLAIWSNSNKAFMHQHNSIGCRISPVQKVSTAVPQIGNEDMELIGQKVYSIQTTRTPGLQIEFPPEERGDFEIIIRVMSTHDYGDIYSDNLGYALSSVRAWKAGGANIEGISDMVLGVRRGKLNEGKTNEEYSPADVAQVVVDGGTSCIDGYLGMEVDRTAGSTISAAVHYATTIVRLHVRVTPATAGDRNILQLYMQHTAPSTDTSPATITLKQTTVEIKEYNALDDLKSSKGFINKVGQTLQQVKRVEEEQEEFDMSNL